MFDREKIKLIDTTLSNTRPTYEITRTIESVSDFKDWKASSYRTFVSYFFPVLDGILPLVRSLVCSVFAIARSSVG